MGEVYSARDSRLHRQVAIKTLPPAFSEDANRLARFQREAQALAALSHPNIAAIYGLEESGGATALVMELIDGQTLAERIAAGPIPVAEALAIARQIGAALEAAHEKGIVHRDLKPANIKINGEGQVKVLDFGLAKAMDRESTSGSGAPPANSPTLTLESTTAGMIMGTAAYMSPEQARGKPVDKRADIWAFGVVFLEMLTGRSPFEGETVSDTLAGVLRADVDLKTLPADTPPAIHRLIEHCLQKDPKRRLRDIGDAWIEIDSPADASVPVAATPPAKTSRMPWIACGAAVLAAIAAVAWASMHKPAAGPQPVVRWSYAPDRILVGLSLSHDGSRLVYMEVAQTPILAMRMMDQLEPKPIPDTYGAFPTFSPDGQWIGFLTPVHPYQLKKMPVSGGTAITLCDYPGTGRGIAWGDDGNIVMDGPKGLMRVSSSGGTPEAITTIDTAKHETAHGWPFVMPGSHAVLFSIASGSSSDVAAVDLRTHAIHLLVKNASVPHYTASGHLIYRRTETLFAAPFNASRLEVTGPEAPVVENVAGINADGGDYTISDGGLLAYVSGGGAFGQGGPTVLNWADRKGTLEPVSEPKQWGTGRLSPDMSHVANGIVAGDAEDIWTYDLVRRTPLRLTFEGKSSIPIWSPDGRWITFVGVRNDKTALYRVAADASGKPELLVETEANAAPNSWSPDGKTLVFAQPGPDKQTHLWSVTVPGGKASRLHESDASESNGEVSPDGHWLAYASTESGNIEVYVQPFPGSGAKTRISTQGGSVPRWSHNGKEIFFWNFNIERQLFVVDVQPGTVFHAGLPQALFKAPVGTTWDVAADGKRFLVETPASAGNGRRTEFVVNWFEELNRRVPVKK